MEQLQKIFILGPGRSGTTLMCNLLDNHPDLCVYPIEVSRFLTEFFNHANFSAESVLSEMNRKMYGSLGVADFGGIRESNVNMPVFDLKRLDKKIFWESMNDHPDSVISLDKYLDKIFMSLQKCMGDKTNKKSGVMDVTSPHIERYLKYLPTSKIIFMIRHPWSCYNSYKKVYFQNVDHVLQVPILGTYFPDIFLDTLRETFRNLKLFQDNPRVLIVRLEDLQSNPEPIMRKVANFLEVPFTESMLQLSVLGKPFAGNTFKRNPNIVSDEIVSLDYSDNFLTDDEKHILSKIIPDTPFYKIDYRETQPKPLGFWRFISYFPGWWKTKKQFPQNFITLINGLYLYIKVYKSYGRFVQKRRTQIEEGFLV
ncbi:MAG: sulfotransferase [Candidatus Omnitrophica bacterium]|nr:sulfotransferase [Candidatus Omnitrophota bacterium]